MPEQTAQPRTRQSAVREVLVALFATPAALSVLAKLDSRLDFTGLLERIILNFDRVAQAVSRALSHWIGVDLSRYYEFLTFAALMLAPILIGRIRRWLAEPVETLPGKDQPRQDSGTPVHEPARDPAESSALADLIPVTALAFVLFLAWLFRIGDSLLFLMSPAFLIIGVTILLIFGWKPREAIGPVILGLVFVVSGAVGFWNDVVDLYRWDGPLDVKLVFVIFSAIGLTLVALALSECTKTLAYIAFWVAGIVAVNWVATVGIPAIEHFLGTAGA